MRFITRITVAVVKIVQREIKVYILKTNGDDEERINKDLFLNLK